PKEGPAKYRGGGARSWKLAELFLREVLGMEKTRIEAIRRFSDKVADRILSKNDKRLWRALAYDKLGELQARLRRVQQESAKDELMFGLDEYAAVWLHEDRDAFLVRDLLAIRVVERLHEQGWFKAHPEESIDRTPEGEESAAP